MEATDKTLTARAYDVTATVEAIVTVPADVPDDEVEKWLGDHVEFTANGGSVIDCWTAEMAADRSDEGVKQHDVYESASS